MAAVVSPSSLALYHATPRCPYTVVTYRLRQGTARPRSLSTKTAAAPAVAAVAAVIASSSAGGATVLGMPAAAVFGHISALMVPLYVMMAFFPKAKLTRTALLNSPVLYLAMAALYTGTLVAAWQAGLGHALSAMAGQMQTAMATGLAGGPAAAAAAVASLDLSPLAHLFSQPLVTLLAWLHLLMLDILMAREVALDGIRTGVATAHSVLLCFFFGPTGHLSHALTRMLSRRAHS